MVWDMNKFQPKFASPFPSIYPEQKVAPAL